MPSRLQGALLARTSIAWLALAAILLSGLGQNVARYGARVFEGQRLDHGVHTWLMTPVGDSLLIIPMMVLLVLLSGRWRWLRRGDVVWSVALGLMLLTALAMTTRLHIVASAFLAIGAASQLGRFAARSIGERGIRSLALLLAAITASVGVPFAIWPAIQEQRTLARLPSARADAPNVLFLLLDTVRAASLDLYGCDKPTTPALRELARSGVVFDWTIAPASYSLPSHASMFTGKWAHELSASWATPLDDSTPTLAEVLSRTGYRTGAFSGNRIYVTREWGLGRGFAHFEEHRIGWQQAMRSSALVRRIVTSEHFRRLVGFNEALAEVTAEQNSEALTGWLERDRSRPWFAFVNFMDAHTPYLPSDSFATRFGWYDASASSAKRWAAREFARRDGPPPPGAQSLRPAYEAAIAELDAHIGALISDLRQRRLLDNTLLIITSDHGEEFGEHQGVNSHGNSLYLRAIHVPLLLVMPGQIPEGRRATEVVSTRDIPATILDLVGARERLPGRSMREVWASSDHPDWSPVLSELRHNPRLPVQSKARFATLSSVIDEGVQLIRTGADSIEIFDLSAAPAGSVRLPFTPPMSRLIDALPPPRR